MKSGELDKAPVHYGLLRTDEPLRNLFHSARNRRMQVNDTTKALNIAAKILDGHHDPDDDASILARQFEAKLWQRNKLLAVVREIHRMGTIDSAKAGPLATQALAELDTDSQPLDGERPTTELRHCS